MTSLVIGPAEEQLIADLVLLAEKSPLAREDLARMSKGFDPSDPATRDQAANVIPLQFTIDLPVGVRVTFTHEEQPIGLCRHMSVSIAKAGMLPGPAIVDELLSQFGFAGRFAASAHGLLAWPERYGSGRVAWNVLERICAPGVEVGA